MRLGVLATHPIQYHAPLYRELAKRIDLHVYFAHRQSATGQADAGFGVPFAWDVDLLGGYEHSFLENRASTPSTDTFFGCDTPSIREILARKSFDAFLVTGWYTKSYWQAMTACWRTGTPLLIRGDSHLGTPRSSFRQAIKSVAYRSFIPRFDGHLVVGQRNREYYLHYGAASETMFEVPHFVDTDWFATEAQEARQNQSELRTRNGLRPDGRVLLFAGKFTSIKRPLDFVEVISKLSAQEPDIQGAMVGDGPLRSEVEAELAESKAPVHLLGFRNQSEMPAMYAMADVLALPSAHETWGLVINEAQACGLPVVATNVVGCAPDLIDEDHTGRTFPVGDLDAFAKAAAAMLRAADSPETQTALHTMTRLHSLDRAVEGVLHAVQTVSHPPTA